MYIGEQGKLGFFTLLRCILEILGALLSKWEKPGRLEGLILWGILMVCWMGPPKSWEDTSPVDPLVYVVGQQATWILPTEVDQLCHDTAWHDAASFSNVCFYAECLPEVY